ncbi:MAG: UDP-4-amino-4-deoxy-L-arabinose--oxoglutarate aminotransferase [Syntrophorhabdus sp. PtaB.Bin047]|nr:MAG: UDP-4-amino-4-deoxy-L-arabinose--oxoglutarate aminotransferase [Syntrophorhabdus sp. PtaB.Bin047]
MTIPVSRPSIGQEELKEVGKVFATGWLGLGSTVFEFEKELEGYLGARHVLAVNSGTTALHIALDALGVGRGDEVIVPSLTFCASVQAITSLGAVPVFCEVSPEDLNINVADVERRITRRTKAIMPVHYCGQACDMDRLLEMGRAGNISIVEDAAHAFGSSWKGRRLGSFGDVTCFSFDPIKNLTCGEGGAVVLSDDGVAELVRTKRILGIDKDTWHRYRNERAWFYEVTTQGYRYHMSNINAAIGLAQLKKFESFVEKKKDVVRRYNEAFRHIEGLRVLNWNLDDTAPFTYILRVLNDRREELIAFLAQRDIGTGIHYIPNHLQPFFKEYSTPLPATEEIGEQILTLPLFYDMTEEQIRSVIRSVSEFFL